MKPVLFFLKSYQMSWWCKLVWLKSSIFIDGVGLFSGLSSMATQSLISGKTLKMVIWRISSLHFCLFLLEIFLSYLCFHLFENIFFILQTFYWVFLFFVCLWFFGLFVCFAWIISFKSSFSEDKLVKNSLSYFFWKCLYPHFSYQF